MHWVYLHTRICGLGFFKKKREDYIIGGDADGTKDFPPIIVYWFKLFLWRHCIDESVDYVYKS